VQVGVVARKTHELLRGSIWPTIHPEHRFHLLSLASHSLGPALMANFLC